MIVVTLSKCPASLRGDLTLWLQEIATGVFVGQVNARVRDRLWQRIIENVKTGTATMSYTTNNEQRYTFRTHNTLQEAVDFDGLELVLWPNKEQGKAIHLRDGFSKASQYRYAQRAMKGSGQTKETTYVFLDLETTGLDPSKHQIIEIAALRLEGDSEESFHAYIKQEQLIPEKIQKLTGITGDLLDQEGKPLLEVLSALRVFIGGSTIIGHNLPFDLGFLDQAFKDVGVQPLKGKHIDTLALARRKLRRVPSYKLVDLAKQIGYEYKEAHNALEDCKMTAALYCALTQDDEN